jgi:hypothetical protein
MFPERSLENNVCRVAPFLFSQYIARMLSRVRNSRGRPINAPAAFIHPCRPIVVQVRSIKGVAENQKSEGTRCNTRRQWYVLTAPAALF